MKNKKSFDKLDGKCEKEDSSKAQVIRGLKEEDKMLSREEEEIEKSLKELTKKEMELKVQLMKLELDKTKVVEEAKRVNMDCSWYAKEMKYLFCKGFILEIAYKIEQDFLRKEEMSLNLSKEPSFASFGKILKSFEVLQKFQREIDKKFILGFKSKKYTKMDLKSNIKNASKVEEQKRCESEKNLGRIGRGNIINTEKEGKRSPVIFLTPTRQILKALR